MTEILFARKTDVDNILTSFPQLAGLLTTNFITLTNATTLYPASVRLAASTTVTVNSGTPNVVSFERTALTGDITAPANSNTTTLATVNGAPGTFGSATQVAQVTVNAKGLATTVANVTIALTSSAVTDFTEAAQDAVGTILTDSATIDFTYNDGANTITAIVIDNSITYAKMQDVSATSRFLGRITAGAGDTEELTGAQANTLLPVFTGVLNGLVPLSGGGTVNFLRADGSWVPGGSGAATTEAFVTIGNTAGLSAERALTAGAGITITDGGANTTVTVLLDTASNRNVDHTAVTITTGNGLTGGGDISANRTFAVGAGTGITANADDIAVNFASTADMETGTSTVVAVNPGVFHRHVGAPKLWGECTYAAGIDAPALGLNFNITSITDDITTVTLFNFAITMSSTGYACFCGGAASSANSVPTRNATSLTYSRTGVESTSTRDWILVFGDI